MERRCSKCLAFKAITEFGNDKKGKNGKSYRCKECAKKAASTHYLQNHERGIEVRRQYYQNHKEENSIKCREYRDAHKEELKAYQKKWRAENPELVKRLDHEKYIKRREAALKRQREYVAENIDSMRIKRKQYRAKNLTKIKAQIQEWYVKKKKTDPGFRILCNLRRRLSHAIAGNNKSARTVELLGCDIPTFMAHLESKFTEGMTWSNYGKWEVDHIVPFAAHSMDTEEGQRASFHYLNTQPLWKFDNQSKGKRFSSSNATA